MRWRNTVLPLRLTLANTFSVELGLVGAEERLLSSGWPRTVYAGSHGVRWRNTVLPLRPTLANTFSVELGLVGAKQWLLSSGWARTVHAASHRVRRAQLLVGEW